MEVPRLGPVQQPVREGDQGEGVLLRPVGRKRQHGALSSGRGPHSENEGRLPGVGRLRGDAAVPPHGRIRLRLAKRGGPRNHRYAHRFVPDLHVSRLPHAARGQPEGAGEGPEGQDALVQVTGQGVWQAEDRVADRRCLRVRREGGSAQAHRRGLRGGEGPKEGRCGRRTGRRRRDRRCRRGGRGWPGHWGTGEPLEAAGPFLFHGRLGRRGRGRRCRGSGAGRPGREAESGAGGDRHRRQSAVPSAARLPGLRRKRRVLLVHVPAVPTGKNRRAQQKNWNLLSNIKRAAERTDEEQCSLRHDPCRAPSRRALRDLPRRTGRLARAGVCREAAAHARARRGVRCVRKG
mmetsp:Transcript_20123/g.50763  ORF Transcript_20123/g.50763 Transcript_20123/m.50763 type:complete len:348 (-) Transcript_20123:1287-2330(-)